MDSPDDLSDRWQARFGEAVGGYLRSGGGMPPEVGAAAFAGLIDGAWAHRGPGRYDIEEALWPAWQAVISAADTPDDAARARLVALLRALRDRGLQARAGGQEYVVWGRPVLSGELPLFGPQLRENWNDAPPARSPASWANLNAFAAQLTAGGIDFSLYASWALRDALEDDEPELSQVLPAAVQWLRLAGALLASLARKGVTSDERASQPGPRCQRAGLTTGGFTIRRWDFWRARLEEIAAAGGEAADQARQGLRYLLEADDGHAREPAGDRLIPPDRSPHDDDLPGCAGNCRASLNFRLVRDLVIFPEVVIPEPFAGF